MLPLCPYAHEKFDVVDRPRTALEVAIGFVQGWGISSTHTDVSDVPTVEVTADGDDFSRAPGVERQVEAHVRDEVIEAFVSVDGGASERER